MSIAVLGSITQDHIIIEKRDQDYHQTGGGVYYSSMTLAALGVDVVAIPLLAKVDTQILDSLTHPRISLHPVWTKETTTYRIRFPHETLDVREMKAIATATGVAWSDRIADSIGMSSAIHISPLSPNEFDPSFYKTLRSHFRGLISLDGQGLVRGRCPDLETFLSGTIDILKCDDTEILQLTRCATEDLAIQTVRSLGVSEILVTRASRGSTLYFNDKTHPIPATKPSCIVDSTGCGDSYIAGYLHLKTQGNSPLECAHFASRVAAKNIEVHGAIASPCIHYS